MPVATAQQYAAMLDAVADGGYALPALNVASSETLNGTLRGLTDAGADGIVARVLAAPLPILVALHTGHAPPARFDAFVDGSGLPLNDNLRIASGLLDELAPLGVVLEVEAGVVGGEEDGIAGPDAGRAGDLMCVVDVLGAGERGRYLLAASFGNVHGVYAPGHVVLRPAILREGQVALVERRPGRRFEYVFHGSSGSDPADVRAAIGHGVVKINLDTDGQYAFTRAIADHVLTHYDGVLRVDALRRRRPEPAVMTALARLSALGTSVWLDGLVPPAELERVVRDEHVTGLTSNPAIFQAAVLGTERYGSRVAALAGRPPAVIYETLAIEDVRAAAEVLAPVYARTGGADGFVSLEVAPALADDADATVSAARELWRRIDRPNAMIKIPATAAGVEATRRAIADGINVANARAAYALATSAFAGRRFAALPGARPQRPLWASTGTKDARYSDVKYVDELAGPGVVDTMPPATLAAFAHHGDPYDCLTATAQAAHAVLDELAAAGIDLPAVTEHLLDDGVDRFAAAMEDLLAGLAAPAAV